MALPFTKQEAAALTFKPEDYNLSNMTCAVCIVEDEDHDRFSVVRRCVAGTMRCNDHTMQCANCKQEVNTDAELLCFACSDSGQGSIYHERLVKAPTKEVCFFEKATVIGVWGCACAKCMDNTLQFYLARAIEEGYASSLSSPLASPRTKSDDNVGF